MSYGKAIVVGGLLGAGAVYLTNKFVEWAFNQADRDETNSLDLAGTLGTPDEEEEKDNG